jgi:mRNA m6A methyltransferase catalytic subunit
MDPPWILSSVKQVRGVKTNYTTLNENDILNNIPFDTIQQNGFLFIWVINAKYRFALHLFAKYGYKLVDELVWVKQTNRGKIAKGHGYYLQHAKETCLIGYKGDLGDRLKGSVNCDVIFSQRRGQS